jgi:hypothetical protein
MGAEARIAKRAPRADPRGMRKILTLPARSPAHRRRTTPMPVTHGWVIAGAPGTCEGGDIVMATAGSSR